MSALSCCRKSLFIFLSILVPGALFVLFGVALVVGMRRSFFSDHRHILYVCISVIVVTFLLFILSARTSLAGSHKGITCLMGTYVVLAIVICGGGIALLIVKPSISWAWTGSSANRESIARALEDMFGCCGWNLTNPRCSHKWGNPCAAVVGPDLGKYRDLIGYVLIGFALGLEILSAFGCCVIDRPQPKRALDIPSIATLRYTEPLPVVVAAPRPRGW
jgi:hypothetical protein